MDRHLIVVSVDALVYEDLSLLSTLPNIGGLMREGSLVKQVTTIYPSLTHPVHTALMTGCAAGKNGVPSNTLFLPGCEDAPWYNALSQVQCDTLFHAAKRAGLVTAACRWPLTDGGFDQIDYLVPETMGADEAAAPSLAQLYRRVCTPCLYEDIIQKHLPLLDAPRHPAYEEFSMRCAADIIRKYKPHLLLTHPGHVDACRHETGLYSESVREALRLTDRWVGYLLDAVREAGLAECTSFAIVSDHGHMEWVRTAAPNVLLRERGLLSVTAEGALADWQLYAQECGLSCAVHVRDKARAQDYYPLLCELAQSGLYGFTEVLTKAQAQSRYGLDGDFSFWLEGDGYTAFSSRLTGSYITPMDGIGCGGHHSSHGHMPEKGPQPVMVVAGPAFQSGVTLAHTHILNEAPTFAAALGFSLPQADGRPIEALLKAQPAHSFA